MVEQLFFSRFISANCSQVRCSPCQSCGKMQAHVDYTEVKPIPHQLTIQFINNFVVNTTQFLNKFALTCDDKLRDVHNRIQRLEITMNILDAKLNSIDGLDDVQVAASTAAPSSSVATTQAPSSVVQQEVVVEVQPQPVSGGMKNKDDPRYEKYFRQLKYGVSLAQVQTNMMMEGVPPSILEYVSRFTWAITASSNLSIDFIYMKRLFSI